MGAKRVHSLIIMMAYYLAQLGTYIPVDWLGDWYFDRKIYEYWHDIFSLNIYIFDYSFLLTGKFDVIMIIVMKLTPQFISVLLFNSFCKMANFLRNKTKYLNWGNQVNNLNLLF